MEQTADISSVRRTNYLSVTGYVRKHGSCPIPHIAQELGLSLPTVTRAVNFALECGVFIPDGMCTVGRGRRAVSYTLNPDFKHCALLYFFSDTLHCDIYDFKFNRISSYLCGILNENAIETIEKNVLNLIGLDTKISHILFAVPGNVNNDVLEQSWKFPSLNGVNLKEHFSYIEGVEFLAFNNMYAVTCSSWKYTSDYHSKTVVSYTFGKKKYGAGVSVNGVVLNGATGKSCDIGRLATTFENRQCLGFYTEQAVGLISLFDPDKLILYPNDPKCPFELLVNALCERYGDGFRGRIECGIDLYDDCAHGLLRLFNRELKTNYS